MGRHNGVTERQMQELPRWRDSDAFDDLERLVLELADAMTDTPADVPAELHHELIGQLGAGRFTELTATIAWENHRARLNRAFGVRAMGFSDGATCVLPASHGVRGVGS